MAKFKIGDMVIAQKKAPYSKTTDGWIGTVDNTRRNYPEDIYVKGEDKAGYPIGFWVDSRYFDLYSDAFNVKKIVIERIDVKTVEATAFNESGKEIAKAKAKCAPEDKWDFYFGTNLAIERLEKNIEKKSSLNTEMVCIKNSSGIFKDCFTMGKIYKVENGILECNHDRTPSIYQNDPDYNCKIFKSVNEINAVHPDIQFLEIVK